jgi:hypothetical protein
MIMKKIAEENCTITEFQRTNGTIKGDFVTYESVAYYVGSGEAFRKRIFETKDRLPFYSPASTSFSLLK